MQLGQMVDLHSIEVALLQQRALLAIEFEQGISKCACKLLTIDAFQIVQFGVLRWPKKIIHGVVGYREFAFVGSH